MKKTYELVDLSDTEWRELLADNNRKQEDLRSIQLQRIDKKMGIIVTLLTLAGKNL